MIIVLNGKALWHTSSALYIWATIVQSMLPISFRNWLVLLRRLSCLYWAVMDRVLCAQFARLQLFLLQKQLSLNSAVVFVWESVSQRCLSIPVWSRAYSANPADLSWLHAGRTSLSTHCNCGPGVCCRDSSMALHEVNKCNRVSLALTQLCQTYSHWWAALVPLGAL